MAQQKSAKPLPDGKTMKLFFEKVYLQTDRNYFSTGEDVWFSAYLVNGKSTSLTSSGANLYVELVSPQSEILDKKTILLNKGLGNGDFKLPDLSPQAGITYVLTPTGCAILAMNSYSRKVSIPPTT